MANYYYIRRRRWNRGGRYYGRNYGYRRTGSRKAYGNMRAAKQQADQATFTINIPSQISTFLSDRTIKGNTQQAGVYAMNIFEQCRKSDFFQNYANMYDEFKIDKIKVKLLPSQWAANFGGRDTYYKNMTIYTAWDRTGLDQNQLQFDITNANQIDKIADMDYTLGNSNGGGLYCTIGSDITSYSSAESRVVNPNSNTSIIRWLSPKTMQEKSQWLSCGSLRQWYTHYDKNNGRYYGIPVSQKVGYNAGEDISAANHIIDSAGTAVGIFGIMDQFSSTINSENPCSLYEDTGIKFKPTLLVGVYPLDNNEATIVHPSGDDPGITAPANQITFNVETEVVCTFRGLRKSKVVAA